MSPSTAPQSATDRASAWIALVRSGQMSAAQLAELKDWLAADAGNEAAFGETAALWSSLHALRAHPSLLRLREEATRASGRRRRRRLAWAGGLAASLLLVASLAVLIQRPRAVAPQDSSAGAVYTTQVGQIANVALSDGSLVVLDTDSVLKVSAWRPDGPRALQLVRGRAHFKVAKAANRPFTVTAAGGQVTALGTEFDVYVRPRGLEVDLIHGRVEVKPPSRDGKPAPPAVRMSPGYRLIATGETLTLRQQVMQDDARWTTGRLVFDNAPIGEIAEELNRYGAEKIVIADRAAAQTRMSGVFGVRDGEAFVAAIEAMGVGKGVDEPGRVVVIAPQ